MTQLTWTDEIASQMRGWAEFSRSLLGLHGGFGTVPRSHRGAKTAAVGIGAASALVLCAGVASAYVDATAGVQPTGGGGTVTPGALTVTASAATLSGALYPGATADLVVTVTNPYSNQSLTVTGATAGTGIASVSGGTGCTVQNDAVSVTSPTSISPATIAAGGQGQVTLTGAVAMGAGSADGCQGASFTVPVALTLKVG